MVWRLVHRQLPDFFAERDRRFERQARTGGGPKNESRSAGRMDKRVNILHLPFDRIGPGVPAAAAPAPVIGGHREVRRQQAGQFRHGSEGLVAQCAIHQQHRRPLAARLIGNLRTVS